MSAKVSLFAAILALVCSGFVAYFALVGRGVGRRESANLSAFKSEVDGRLTDLERRVARLAKAVDEQGPTEVVETERGHGGESEERLVQKLMQLGVRVENLELQAAADDQDPVSRGHAYLDSEDSAVRKEGVRLLRKLGRRDPEIIARLRQMLDDDDAAVRREALEGLKDAEDYDAIPLIVGLLKDPDSGVREKATQVLSTLLDTPQR